MRLMLKVSSTAALSLKESTVCTTSILFSSNLFYSVDAQCDYFFLNSQHTARLMQEQPDCFCVKDSAGHKVCEPDNCDVGREATPVG